MIRELLDNSWIILGVGAFVVVGIDIARTWWARRHEPGCAGCPCCGWSETER